MVKSNKGIGAINFHHLLDTSGLYCPEPLMLLHAKMNELQAGEVLKLIATDPATLRDVPKFCHFLQVNLLKQETNDNEIYNFWLNK